MERGAFGWPTGSVRAVLAFTILVPTVMVLVFLAAMGSATALALLAAMAGSALTHYFTKINTPPA